MDRTGYLIAGPTGSGKSQLALDLAGILSQESLIINADSMQVYADLQVISARPKISSELPPHALYGTLGAHESASVVWWSHAVKNLIESSENTHKPPIIVGGTGLYLNVLLNGISPMPDIPPQVREGAISDYQKLGPESFFEKIRQVDPISAEKIDPNNTQRVIRAWEVYAHTGKPLSYWQAQPKVRSLPNWNWKVVLIEPDREDLYPHLNDRFKAMVHEGGLEEVKNLHKMNLPNDASILNAIGVRELLSYIKGEISLEEAIEKGQQATRNYAKRQLTWFRHQLNDINLKITDMYTQKPCDLETIKALTQK